MPSIVQRAFVPTLALFTVASLLLAGCGVATRPQFLAYSGPHNGNLARAGGQLVRQGDCIYIQSRGSEFLLALPTDVAWDRSEDALVFDGQHYPMGVFVAVGGSAIDYAQAPAILHAGWATPAARSCDTSSVWLTGGMSRDESGR